MMNGKPKPALDWLSLSISLSGIASGLVLVVYAYLGIFSRQMADDFCSVDFTRTNFFAALWGNYLTISDRFSNFALMALSEGIWPRSVMILPALMLILWVIGIAWLLHECSNYVRLGWSKVFILSLTCLLIFFALLQAPNMYQILYWRSSMATHFAPLVLMPFFAAFLLRSISAISFPRVYYPLVFILAFILGGFSEPTVAILIALLGLSIVTIWLWMDSEKRGSTLRLLVWSMIGAMLALFVMAIAPANSFRLGDAPPTLSVLISRSFEYVFEFSINSFKTLPLPSFFNVLIPFLIFFGIYADPVSSITPLQRRLVLFVMISAPVISYLLMVGSFAPSVYGQSFPVERARFSAQLILTILLMIEGAGLGILLAQWRPGLVLALPVKTIAAFILIIAAFYPLRAAFHALRTVPEYSERAKLWDAREAYIYRKIALGEMDIVVPGYPGIYGVKEWDDHKSHWVNRCVARYYNIQSIYSTAMPDEYILEYLSE